MKTDYDFTKDVSVKINEDISMSIMDSTGNRIYYKNPNGYEIWNEYDVNGNKIHVKDSHGFADWYLSDGTKISKQEFDFIHNSSGGKIVTVDGKDYKLVPL